MMLWKEGQGREGVGHVLEPRRGHKERPSEAQCCPDKDLLPLSVVKLCEAGTHTSLNPGPSSWDWAPASPSLGFLNRKTQDNTRHHECPSATNSLKGVLHCSTLSVP